MFVENLLLGGVSTFIKLKLNQEQSISAVIPAISKQNLIGNVKCLVPRCRRCNRKLKNPESIELGFGSTCYKKIMRSTKQKSLF